MGIEAKPDNPGEKWKLFYQENNLVWENKDYFSDSYLSWYIKSEWIQKLVKNTKPGIKILDAGCGTGLIPIALAYAGYEVTAIDYNDEAIQIAKENLEIFNSSSSNKIHVNFLKSDLLKLDFKSNKFDLVFNQAVLEYFIDDSALNKAIEEMVRVTKPNGKVKAIVQNTGNPLRHIWNLMNIGGYENQPNVRQINRKILIKIFKRRDLIDIKIDGLYTWKSIFKVPSKWKGKIYYFYRFCEKFIQLPLIIRSRLGIQLIVESTKI